MTQQTFHLKRPERPEAAPYYWTYIDKVPGNDFLTTLKEAKVSTAQWLRNLPADKWDYRYAADKWTMKEAWLHLIDTERIFAYRALRIARNDQTPLPGYEQDDYVPASNANQRTAESLIREYEIVREASIALFEQLGDEALSREGTASTFQFTPRGLGYTICGHELHHIEVTKERYL